MAMPHLKLSVLLAGLLCVLSHATAQDKFQPNVDPSAHARLLDAKSAKANGDTKKAVDILSDLTKERPDYYSAQYNLGLVLADTGKNSEAVKALSQAKAIKERENIKDPTIYNSLGWAYMLQGRFPEAETSLKQAKDNESSLSQSSRARLNNNLGVLYMNTGRLDLARQALESSEKDGNQLATKNLTAIDKVEKSVKEK